MEEYIKFKAITGMQKEDEDFFTQMCTEINKMYNQYKDDDFFKKAFEFYGNSWVDYFEVLSQNGQYFISKSLPFMIYSTCYIAVEHKYFGIFHSFFRIFVDIIAESEEKKVIMQKLANLYIMQVKNLNDDEFYDACINEQILFDDSINISTCFAEAVNIKLKSFETFIRFVEYVFKKENLTMTEKSVAFRILEQLKRTLKYEGTIKLTLYYGVDEDNKPVCHYKDLDISSAPSYDLFYFADLYQHLDTLTDLQRSTMTSFFLLSYVLHMNNFYLKPFIREKFEDQNQEDKANNKLFIQIHKLLMSLFCEKMPNVFKERFEYSLEPDIEETIKDDLDLFILDGSIKLYDNDFTLNQSKNKKETDDKQSKN